jgi:hypothetical protein
MGARDALRDAEKITARMKRLVPHLTATIVSDAGHAVLNTPRYVLPFLASASRRPGD